MSWANPSLSTSSSWGDHKFVLIKHGNEHYQLVQNYQGTAAREVLNLLAWQASGHEYSSKLGFSKAAMVRFLSSLDLFAQAQGPFSASVHADLFGVRVNPGPGGSVYWPSMSHQELDDDSIHGSGSRCMANALESVVDDQIKK
jgi:hypothetical protein